MAFVIGKQCRHDSKDEASSVIAGITICNDVSVRDWQLANCQSLTLTSLQMVIPAITDDASSLESCRHCLPITNAISAS